jgi:hypothetical protein
MSRINQLLGRVAEPETPEDRDEAWNEISAQLQRQHEQEGFLRYLIACAGHSSFDLKAHVPRIKRLLGDGKSKLMDLPKEMEHFRQKILKGLGVSEDMLGSYATSSRTPLEAYSRPKYLVKQEAWEAAGFEGTPEPMQIVGTWTNGYVQLANLCLWHHSEVKLASVPVSVVLGEK